jgi:putative addiction module CopG family antidote
MLDRIAGGHAMNVTLTPEAEALVRRKVATGPYRSVDEVIEEALRALEERDRLARLKAALATGDEQYARGEVKTWTPETLDRLKREAAENVRNGKPIKDEVKP